MDAPVMEIEAGSVSFKKYEIKLYVDVINNQHCPFKSLDHKEFCYSQLVHVGLLICVLSK